MYYRNAQAAVVVYDVTKASSLEKAKTWVKELQRQANPNIVIALAGNKVDLVQPSSSSPAASPTPESDDEADDATATPGEASASGDSESLRQVPREEAESYAQEAGLLFFETSAKTGEGVVELFTEIGMCYSYPRHVFISSSPLQPRRFLSTRSLLQHGVTQVVLVLLVPGRLGRRVVSTSRRMLPRARSLVPANHIHLSITSTLTLPHYRYTITVFSLSDLYGFHGTCICFYFTLTTDSAVAEDVHNGTIHCQCW